MGTQKKWAGEKDALARSTSDSGVNFEKLAGYDNLFSVGLNQSMRAILEREGGSWTAITIGPHDAAYSRGSR